MMTVKELRDMCVDGEHPWGSFTIKWDGEGDVDIFKEGSLRAWLKKSCEGEQLVYEHIDIPGDIKNIDDYIELAQLIGMTLQSVKPVTVEKRVDVVGTDQFVLQGKVEAYEKIIIGRALTVSA